MNVFTPENIRYNKSLPKVMFSSLHLFGKEIEVGKEYDGNVILPEDLNTVKRIELDYSQSVFVLEVGSDNFNLPEKTAYMYRLDGFNDEWLALPAGMNRLTFTNLAPGKYVLNVKAVNSDGYEGTEVSRLGIIVHPPFWLSWWATCAMASSSCWRCCWRAGISCGGSARSSISGRWSRRPRRMKKSAR